MTVVINGDTGVSGVDGTAGTPALQGNDTNTGIFFPAADTIAFAEGGVEVARFDSSGNLGVGTSSPSSFSGYTTVSVNNATNGGIYNILVNGTETARLQAFSGIFNVAARGASTSLTFETNSTERARIDNLGSLLVGTTTLPTNSASVAGVGVLNAGGTAGRINLGKTASGTFDGIANYHNGAYVGGITYSNTATALVASSDERLKENIVAAPPALEKAMSIEVVSYDWKHDPTHVEFGLVAQRLNSVYPEAVNVGDDGAEVEKTWGVEYGRLTPMLLKAIQEQQQMIEELKAKVAALEAR
jgi:hypothetical protein